MHLIEIFSVFSVRFPSTFTSLNLSTVAPALNLYTVIMSVTVFYTNKVLEKVKKCSCDYFCQNISQIRTEQTSCSLYPKRKIFKTNFTDKWNGKNGLYKYRSIQLLI